MGLNIFSQIKANSLAPVVVAGSFKPQGADTDCTVLEGKGFTAAQTDPGLFTITLTQRFPGVYAAFAQVAQDDLAEVNKVNLRAHVVSTSGSSPMSSTRTVLTVTVLDSDEDAPDALDGDDDGSVISFVAVLRASSAG